MKTCKRTYTCVYVVFRGVGARVPPRGSSQQLAARRHRQAGVTLAAGRAVPHYQSSAQQWLLSSVSGRVLAGRRRGVGDTITTARLLRRM